MDGEVLEHSRSNGFDYDAVTHTLLFYGEARPELESEIFVSYQHFEDLTDDPAPDPIVP
jgi:hypothetical protein